MVKLFISSVQREFERERREIAAYIRQDAVMGRFFEPFLFEELPAKDVSAQQAYLAEVADTELVFRTDKISSLNAKKNIYLSDLM